MAGRFPFPIPNGWFCVAWSDELAPGQVRPIHYFDRDLVLFRSESGEARVFNAHCVHLGAHLGYGGVVVGETLRCPFHGWRYDGTGRCVEVPYAKRIPPRAQIRAWAVVERNDMIMVWHHLEGKPPFYEVPALSEFGNPEWTQPHHMAFDLRTAVQEMAENDHDTAHFRYVHGSEEINETRVTYDGLTKRAVSTSKRETSLGSFEMTLERVNYGLGLTTVRSIGVPNVGVLLLSSVAPVDDENVCARWAFTVTKNAAESFGAEFIEGISEGVTDDFRIWEHKVYRPKPMLCDGDGPIAEFRRWARNFY